MIDMDDFIIYLIMFYRNAVLQIKKCGKGGAELSHIGWVVRSWLARNTDESSSSQQIVVSFHSFLIFTINDMFEKTIQLPISINPTSKSSRGRSATDEPVASSKHSSHSTSVDNLSSKSGGNSLLPTLEYPRKEGSLLKPNNKGRSPSSTSITSLSGGSRKSGFGFKVTRYEFLISFLVYFSKLFILIPGIYIRMTWN